MDLSKSCSTVYLSLALRLIRATAGSTCQRPDVEQIVLHWPAGMRLWHHSASSNTSSGWEQVARRRPKAADADGAAASRRPPATPCSESDAHKSRAWQTHVLACNCCEDHDWGREREGERGGKKWENGLWWLHHQSGWEQVGRNSWIRRGRHL